MDQKMSGIAYQLSRYRTSTAEYMPPERESLVFLIRTGVLTGLPTPPPPWLVPKLS
jgi:hypothetical protein